jgi:hypothetical protein
MQPGPASFAQPASICAILCRSSAMSMAAAKSGFPALSLADSWFLVADPLLGAGLFF